MSSDYNHNPLTEVALALSMAFFALMVLSIFALTQKEQENSSINSLEVNNNSQVKKESLMKIIKENMFHNQKKYRPISILKWNIDMEPEDISSYLKESSKFNFLTVERKIDTIKFEESINLFHNINSLYIVYHESWKSFNNRTKKIYIGKKKLNRRKTKYKRDLKKSEEY